MGNPVTGDLSTASAVELQISGLIAELSKTSTHRSAFATLSMLEHTQVTVPKFQLMDDNFTIRVVTLVGDPMTSGPCFQCIRTFHPWPKRCVDITVVKSVPLDLH